MFLESYKNWTDEKEELVRDVSVPLNYFALKRNAMIKPRVLIKLT